MNLAQFSLNVKCCKIEMETREVKMTECLLKTDEMFMSQIIPMLSYPFHYSYGIVDISILT